MTRFVPIPIALLWLTTTACAPRAAEPGAVAGAATPATPAAAEPREAVAPAGAHRPEVIAPPGARLGDLPFSPAIRAGGFIFLSGAIGTRPGTTELVGDGVAEQTRQTMENLRAVLRAAGSDLDDVVKCTVFLVDMADYPAMNAAYASFWTGAPPARSTVAGSGLALGARVEIECIAWAPGR